MLKGSVQVLGRPGGWKLDDSSVAAVCHRRHAALRALFIDYHSQGRKKKHTNACISVCPMRCTFPDAMKVSTELELLHATRGSGQMVERVEGGILIAGGGRLGLSRALFSGARISKNKRYLQ